MNELIAFFGRVLRFPIYCVGVLAAIVFWVPIGIIGWILMFVTTPFAFLAAAFKNRPDDFRGHVSELKDPFTDFKYSLKFLARWLRTGET